MWCFKNIFKNICVCEQNFGENLYSVLDYVYTNMFEY